MFNLRVNDFTSMNPRKSEKKQLFKNYCSITAVQHNEPPAVCKRLSQTYGRSVSFAGEFDLFVFEVLQGQFLLNKPVFIPIEVLLLNNFHL